MTIFGKRLAEYVTFSRFFITLILVVGLTRLVLSLGGVPNATARWFSVTAAAWIGVLYYSVRIHARGFGGSKQLLMVCLLLSLAAQAIIVPAIALAIFTSHDNIYSAPEFSFGQDGKTWSHLAAHLLLGTTAGSLVPWLVGTLILLLTRKMIPGSKSTEATASG
ncbi:MAG: hypothetical protein AB1898_09455 [Acidobacteriota bacterium]